MIIGLPLVYRPVRHQTTPFSSKRFVSVAVYGLHAWVGAHPVSGPNTELGMYIRKIVVKER